MTKNKDEQQTKVRKIMTLVFRNKTKVCNVD